MFELQGGPPAAQLRLRGLSPVLDHSDFSVLSLGPLPLFDHPDFVM